MIGDHSRLVSHVSVGAEVEIGENTLLHAGVCIGDRCQIGSRVIIQPNATIGGDGFAYVTPEPGSLESARATGEVKSFNNELVRINSIGNVVIEDNVEIGAGTCVDRGTLGETRVGRGTKLDNLVQVGHNVTIGTNCLIIAQVGLAGSSKVGHRAVIGGSGRRRRPCDNRGRCPDSSPGRGHQACACAQHHDWFSRRIKTRFPPAAHKYQTAPENPKELKESEATGRSVDREVELDSPQAE